MWGQAQTDSDLDSGGGGGGLVRSDGDERARRQRCDEVCEVGQEVCEADR
jgi:hypothetical protein